jgi:hypothetical protein
MRYPDWAPPGLVELHRLKLEHRPTSDGFDPNDPESMIEGIVREHGDKLSEDGIENLRQRLYRNSFVGLPAAESAEILGRLLTNASMESVWKSVKKHAGDELGLIEFFTACENSITGWRGEVKHTKAERNRLLHRVRELSAELSLMLHDCPDFDYFSIANMIDDAQLEGVAEGIVSKEIDLIPGYFLRIDPDKSDMAYFRSCMGDVIPSIHRVLDEVSERAKKIEAQELMAKKPGSKKSHIHFFIRHLHDYLLDQFSKPLHDVVAVTANTIFQDDAIDSSYVRKISNT